MEPKKEEILSPKDFPNTKLFFFLPRGIIVVCPINAARSRIAKKKKVLSFLSKEDGRKGRIEGPWLTARACDDVDISFFFLVTSDWLFSSSTRRIIPTLFFVLIVKKEKNLGKFKVYLIILFPEISNQSITLSVFLCRIFFFFFTYSNIDSLVSMARPFLLEMICDYMK